VAWASFSFPSHRPGTGIAPSAVYRQHTALKRAYSCRHKCDDFIQELKEECEKFDKASINGIKGTIKVAGRRAAYPFRQSTLQKLDEDISEIRYNLLLALDVLQRSRRGHCIFTDGKVTLNSCFGVVLLTTNSVLVIFGVLRRLLSKGTLKRRLINSMKSWNPKKKQEWELSIGIQRIGLQNKPGKKPQWKNWLAAE
jgi:hypothetical protein